MERDTAETPVPKNLQFRVGLLVGLAVVLGAGFVIYALYARGVFEDTQRITLIAENAEGVDIGMDLSFSGFPIGRFPTARCATSCGATRRRRSRAWSPR